MKVLQSLCTSVTLLLIGSQAYGGGILLYESGTPEVGLAAAGWAARAQDAATVATNPAGMTMLENDELLLGTQVLYGNINFTSNGLTTSSGGNGDNALGWFPGLSLYYSHSQSERLKLGLAVYGTFGLALDYGDSWAGRYQFEKGAVLGMTFAPTIAYKLTDKFSIGGALNVMYGYFSATSSVNNPAPGMADGKLEVDDGQFGFGGNFGMLYEISDATRVGLQYTTEISLDFSDTAELTGLGPGLTAALRARGLIDTEVSLDMTVPQTTMLSFFHQLNNTWAILGNLGWQDWSEYGKVGVEIASENPVSLTKDRDYKDSYHAALGAQVDIEGPWLLSFGVAFDSAIVDEENITPDMPNADAWRFAIGGQYALKKNMIIGLGYSYFWMGDLDMDAEGGTLTGRLAGTYEDVSNHFFALNLRWVF